jgi:predicted phosphodiesterase
VAEIADGLYLLAIDSHSSSVSEATLNWITEKALTARAAGKRVIAMMHHPLFPHITGADLFIDTYAVKYQPTSGEATTYETVRNELIAAGVNVILTGHFHTSDIAYDWNNSQTNGIYDINTGSLISYPCDYRMLTLSADKSTLSVTTARLTPTGWTADECKTWLHNRVEAIAKKKMNEKAGSTMAAKQEIADAIDNIATFAADLFILHAKGDENSETNEEEREELKTRYTNYKNNNETVTIQTPFGNMPVYIYKTAFSAGGITDASIYSILDDKSNYGGTHENQTDDRALAVTLTNPGTLLLDNGADNSTAINCYNGKEATVTLTGRTLYKDGKWNTICLPFDINTLTGTPLEDADIRELSTTIVNDGKTTGFNTETNSLILNFTAQEAVTKIEAGKPYIVKWTGGTAITDPSFSGVTINNKAPESVTSSDGAITFVGTYAWQQFTADNTSILLIGKNTGKNTLFYPEAGASLGACRAYFQLANGYTAGDPDPEQGGSPVRNFILNFGDDDSATGIIAIGDSQLSTLNSQRSEWYTLDGRRLAAKPTAKGLYIHAGRKVVIK